MWGSKQQMEQVFCDKINTQSARFYVNTYCECEDTLTRIFGGYIEFQLVGMKDHFRY